MKIRHLVLIVLAFLVVISAYFSYKSPFMDAIIHQKRVNFLFLGVDFVDNSVHSDTVILISYNPLQEVLDVVSIPRDSYVDIENYKFKKITEIYAALYKEKKSKYKAAEELKKIIEEKIFSFEDFKINIPYFFLIDYQNFKKLINAIGKIKIVVTEPMHYDDEAGHLHIHFERGVYYMDGEQALQYIRYRDLVGDLGRISRQQYFIKSLINKMLTPTVWLKFPLILYNIRKCFITNVSLVDFLNIVLEFKNLEITDIRFSTLTGNIKGRYIELDKNMLSSFIRYLSSCNNVFVSDRKVLLKVYNATDKPKLAKQVSFFLRKKGYDVLDWGNWYCKQPRSRIIDCSHNVQVVKELSKLLNIFDVSTSYSQFLPSVLTESANIIIIIGEDFFEKMPDFEDKFL